MKNVLLAVLIITYCNFANSQQLSQQFKSQKKTWSQKTVATVLTATGAAMVIGGAVVLASDADYYSSETVGALLVGGGVAAITGGIILFSAARKGEANEASTVNLKIENANTYRNVRIAKNYYPALSLRIPL